MNEPLPDPNEIARIRFISLIDELKEIELSDDGYYHYWPKHTNGYLSAHHLRWIADELDKRNATYEAQLQEYFEKHKDELLSSITEEARKALTEDSEFGG